MWLKTCRHGRLELDNDKCMYPCSSHDTTQHISSLCTYHTSSVFLSWNLYQGRKYLAQPFPEGLKARNYILLEGNLLKIFVRVQVWAKFRCNKVNPPLCRSGSISLLVLIPSQYTWIFEFFHPQPWCLEIPLGFYWQLSDLTLFCVYEKPLNLFFSPSKRS